MPELPEVETYARSLGRTLVGRRVASVRLVFRPLLRTGSPRSLARLAGRKVESVGRRGKYLIVRFEGGRSLAFHLKMTGGFLFVPKGTRPDKSTRLVLTFRGPGPDLHFRDTRKFGRLYLLRSTEVGRFPAIARLGPEPLELGFEDFARLLRGRRGRLKSLLLNQEFLAGVGNIYADESLFRARLHPLRRARGLKPDEARRLWESIRHILRRAIRRGGSSIRDYADSEGRRGRFQESHRVYGRRGEPCFGCRGRIVREVIGGRASFFCPSCQKAGPG
jgi:formamidopyrimidine-DNA glycosylase